jgi:ArsR family transcriptional regulator
VRLLSMIASADAETGVCDLTGSFQVSGPTISHHLKVLREAGLVEGERRGTWVYYRARTDALRDLAIHLSGPVPAPAARQPPDLVETVRAAGEPGRGG